jgi:hypothetical protein
MFGFEFPKIFVLTKNINLNQRYEKKCFFEHSKNEKDVYRFSVLAAMQAICCRCNLPDSHHISLDHFVWSCGSGLKHVVYSECLTVDNIRFMNKFVQHNPKCPVCEWKLKK